MNKDLTIGEPKKVLWLFCLPLFGSVIFQQLYNVADSFVAGKFIGENALAAVGNSYEVTLIFIAFGFGCNMGCSIISSIYYGSKDYKRLKTTIFTAYIFSASLCLLLMAFGLFGADVLLRLIKTPTELFGDSKLYLDIYIWGLPFVFFYNIATGIFSALGDSKTPFIFLAISSSSNILVDIYFVRNLGMGVAGVAWATFICQGVSCIVSMLVVFKRLKKIEVEGNYKLFDSKILKEIISIALPSTLQQSFISIGNILIQGIINGFGPAMMAGYSAAVKLNNLVITSFTTIGNGISNYTAQNLGAKKTRRIKQGFDAGLKMIWALALPFAFLYFFKSDFFLKLFMDEPSKEALNTGVIFLKILSPFYFVVSTKLVADGILRGSGFMNLFMKATFTDLILRVILAYLFSLTSLKSTGIWCAWPIGWCVASLMSLTYYFKYVKNKKDQNIDPEID